MPVASQKQDLNDVLVARRRLTVLATKAFTAAAQIISVADVQHERLVLRVSQRLKHASKLPLTAAMY